MTTEITLVLGEEERDCRSVLLDGEAGSSIRTMTWMELAKSPPESLGVAAVLCRATPHLAERLGLVAILRRAYPDAPFFSYAPLREAASGTPVREAGLDAHIVVPIASENLRMLIARECRLRSLAQRHREALERIREQGERLELLIETSRAANSLLEPRRVMQLVMDRTQEFLEAEAWSLYLLQERDDSLDFEMTRGSIGREITTEIVPADEGVAGWVVKHHRPALIEDAGSDRRWIGEAERRHGFRARSVLCVPLISRGRMIGAVELLNKASSGGFREKDIEVVRSLMEPAAITIENAILFKKLEDLSVTDDLTRLYNTRYLNQFLQQEIKRSRRYGYSVALLFLDLDGFKTVNDTHGHLSGGRTLVEVGRLIRATVRETDIVSRYGGDEFTVVLPQTGPEGAAVIAERIRAAIEGCSFLETMGIDVRLTASVGIACYPEHGESREELIGLADRAMYRVKEQAKNGVALAAASRLQTLC
jgi:diguanylate cyclase (GGDEF)-like protein